MDFITVTSIVIIAVTSMAYLLYSGIKKNELIARLSAENDGLNDYIKRLRKVQAKDVEELAKLAEAYGITMQQKEKMYQESRANLARKYPEWMDSVVPDSITGMYNHDNRSSVPGSEEYRTNSSSSKDDDKYE